MACSKIKIVGNSYIGGTSDNPITVDTLYAGTKYHQCEWGDCILTQDGVNYNLFATLEIGDGVTESHFDFSKKVINLQGAENSLEIDFNPSNNDTINLSSTTFRTDGKQIIKVLNNGACDFSFITDGLAIINFDIYVDNPCCEISNVTFRNSRLYWNSNKNLNNCIFRNSVAEIDDLDLLNSCGFIADGSSGYAVVLKENTSKNTFNWSGKLEGYQLNNGSTGNEAIHVLATTGIITINVQRGADIPSIHSEGATVIVNPPSYSFKLTNIVEGSEVRIYRKSDMSELAGVENLNGTTFEYIFSLPFGATEDIIVVIFNVNYNPVRFELTIKNEDYEIPVYQERDRWYENP